MAAPNVLLIMTDEERYPPPYEPEERTNLSIDAPAALSEMRTVLEAQRDEKRLLPSTSEDSRQARRP